MIAYLCLVLTMSGAWSRYALPASCFFSMSRCSVSSALAIRVARTTKVKANGSCKQPVHTHNNKYAPMDGVVVLSVLVGVGPTPSLPHSQSG